MPWKPGQSGNPGGRPKSIERDVLDKIRSSVTLRNRFRRLARICASPNDEVALAGIKLWLAYAIGQPTAKVAVDGRIEHDHDLAGLRARLTQALVDGAESGAEADGSGAGEPN